MAMRDVFPQLSMGPLPERGDLNALARKGVLDLVNVSGTPAAEIYGSAILRPFTLHEFAFPDIFSAAHDDEDWARFQRTHAAALHEAIDRLADLLDTGRAVHCFCRLGQSRSSLVAAGALVEQFRLDVEAATTTVRAKNPRASFGPRALAVLQELNGLQPEERVEEG